MKKTVCILYGGCSQEHEVSLQSAASVCNHLAKEIYEIVPIGIDKDNKWHFQEKLIFIEEKARGQMLKIVPNPEPVVLIPGNGLFYRNKKLAIDIIFPVLHGSFGEDGTLQGLLEMLEIPYVGSGVLGSALSMDKEKVKRVWQACSLPVVDFISLTNTEFEKLKFEVNFLAERFLPQFNFPVFVKPARSGSSVGVHKVQDLSTLKKALEDAFLYDTKVIIERAITGREIECAVVGNEELDIFQPGEIIPTHSFYSYEAKYLDPQGAQLVIPAPLSENQKLTAKQLALKAYQAAEASGFARVDLFLENSSAKFYLNEINTIPGFTNISMFPRMCAAGGLAYPELLSSLIRLGLQNFAKQKKLKKSL